VNPIPGNAGSITGSTPVCAGTNGVVYTVAPILNAQAYVWTLPAGASNATGSAANSITVNFAGNATSGPITVTGNNLCGNGNPSPPFNVTINALPNAAGTITGDASVCNGNNGVMYSVPAIANATGYVWTLPAGATIASGMNTNTITVDFSAVAVSGNITVYGTNSCGNGTTSPNFPLTVTAIPNAPVITLNLGTLSSNTPSGNQWYRESLMIPGATGQTYTPTQTGYYWDVVSVNSCSSDTSNNIYFVMVGIGGPGQGESLMVYPNPADGLFTLVFSTITTQTFNLSVVNNLGVTIYSSTGISVDGKVTKTLDLRAAPNGIYSLILQNNETHVVKKIVINK
jgi:hypothetical protein